MGAPFVSSIASKYTTTSAAREKDLTLKVVSTVFILMIDAVGTVVS